MAYIPKHTDSEYMEYIRNNAHHFGLTAIKEGSVNHKPSSTLVLFSVYSQHVEGRCLEECLDNAMIRKGGRGKIR
jgi:hypothetical protein